MWYGVTQMSRRNKIYQTGRNGSDSDWEKLERHRDGLLADDYMWVK